MWHNIFGQNVFSPMISARTRIAILNVFDARRSIFSVAPLLALLSFFPSYLITRAVALFIEMSGHSTAGALPSFELKGLMLFVAIVLGPLFETFLLAVGMWIICRFIKNLWLASAISGVVWSIVHGYQAPLWALGTVWPFMVFSRAYLSWKPKGLSNAIGVAWLAHMFHNALAVACSYLP